MVDLLPALPEAWRAGRVRGLRARGGLEVSFSWAEGKVQELTIRAGQAVTFTLMMNGTGSEVALAAGESRSW